ncbi:hypothetical protein JOC37_000508 [Desulfohalotomaculum tongense]|nr:hypothetical protein [Desulforadius tongensis]
MGKIRKTYDVKFKKKKVWNKNEAEPTRQANTREQLA